MMINSVVLSLILIINIYLFIESISEIKINLIKNFIKKFFSRCSYFHNIKKTLNYINNIYSLNLIILNKVTIFILSLFISILVFILLFNKYRLLIGALLISIIFFFIPGNILELFKKYIKYKIKQAFILYVISIQSYSINSNDVILGLTKVKAIKPLDKYINKFNILINNGYDIIRSFNILIDEIEVEEVSKFFNLLKLCYINGGNLNRVINKYCVFFNYISRIKKIQIEKRNYYFSILLLIFIINIFLIFFVILNNNDYKVILLNTLVGKILIDINILIYFFTFLVFKKILKRED